MDNFIIFQMQATAGLITFFFAFKWFVFPRLAKLIFKPLNKVALPE